MKRLLLLTLCTVIMGACIDKEYDLGKDINTDDVGIGGPDSEFVMPLANIHVGSGELLADNGDITVLFSNVDPWIPVSYKYIEVQRLSDSQYVNQWVEDLCKGMDNDNEFTRVVEHIHKTCMEDFSSYVTPMTDFASYKEAFQVSWSNNLMRSEIEKKIGEAVASEIAAIDVAIDPIDFTIENGGLDEGVIDMLVNEDGVLELFGSILNKMEPIECTLKAEFVNTSVGFDVSLPAAVTAADPAVAIPAVKIPASDAHMIIEQGLLRVTVTPVKFYPRTAYNEGEQMFVQLKLRRKGGLRVN